MQNRNDDKERPQDDSVSHGDNFDHIKSERPVGGVLGRTPPEPVPKRIDLQEEIQDVMVEPRPVANVSSVSLGIVGNLARYEEQCRQDGETRLADVFGRYKDAVAEALHRARNARQANR